MEPHGTRIPFLRFNQWTITERKVTVKKKTSQNSVQQRADINLIHRLAHKHVIGYTHRQTQDRKEEGKESVWFFFGWFTTFFFDVSLFLRTWQSSLRWLWPPPVTMHFEVFFCASVGVSALFW